jgi:hypothetical protein
LAAAIGMDVAVFFTSVIELIPFTTRIETKAVMHSPLRVDGRAQRERGYFPHPMRRPVTGPAHGAGYSERQTSLKS